jgi:cytochrome P450
MRGRPVGQFSRAIRQAAKSSVERQRRVLTARAKSWWKGHRLPPGNFIRLEPLLAKDPKALALKAAATGPILATLWGNKITICITSLPVARRLLQKHKNDLNALSIDITSIVPKGILRTMEGIDHQTYRKAFSRAISASDFPSQAADLRSIVMESLGGMDGAGRPASALCDEIALRMLMRAYLGVARGSATHLELEEQFNAMAPNGFAWNVGPLQKAAFEKIRSRLAALASDPVAGGEVNPDSVLFQLAQDGATDLTTIGNLIYMIEMGRTDISLFLYRIARFLNDDLQLFRRILAGERSALGVPITQAIAHEGLRLEQSERLMRSAKRDFVFDGFLFPKGAVVRICLWEAHKDAGNFDNPFNFDADRYLNTTFDGDQFCPFGMGHHQCPAADTTLFFSSLFIEIYAGRRLQDLTGEPAKLDVG